MTDQQIAPDSKARNAPRRWSAPRTAQVAIALVGVLALVATALTIIVAWPRVPATGPVADLPARYAPWLDVEGATPETALWTSMNDALRAKDRDAFLANATGDAVAQLSRWWDNTTAIGWDTAAISPTGGEDTSAGTQVVVLGAQFGFAAHPVRGSGNADADLDLIQGFAYTVTFAPAADGSTESRPRSFDRYNDDGTLKEEVIEPRKIASIVPTTSPNPWDDGDLHVAKRDHVVLFGLSDEASLVEQTADLAETSATTALDTVRAMGGDLPQEGFVSAITGDESRFVRWRYGAREPGEMKAAGFARATLRPVAPATWLDSTIATGYDTSGTLVVMGPRSTDQRESTFVHELAHALHFTAAPSLLTSDPQAVMEGFARYTEWAAGVEEPGLSDPRVASAIAEKGADAFNDEALSSADAWIGYEAAGSYYEFVAEKGHSPWQMALQTRNGFAGLVGYAEMNPDVSIAAWQEWAATQ